jgi:hypothetical protein
LELKQKKNGRRKTCQNNTPPDFHLAGSYRKGFAFSGNWELGTGNWELGTGNWELGTEN